MTTLTSPSEATPLVPKLVALGVLLIDGHCPLFPPQLIGSLLQLQTIQFTEVQVQA